MVYRWWSVWWTGHSLASGESNTLLSYAGTVPRRGLGVCLRVDGDEEESLRVFGEWVLNQGIGFECGRNMVFRYGGGSVKHCSSAFGLEASWAVKTGSSPRHGNKGKKGFGGVQNCSNPRCLVAVLSLVAPLFLSDTLQHRGVSHTARWPYNCLPTVLR